MKKLISIIIAVILITNALPVDAQTSLTAIRDSRKQQEALNKTLKESYGDNYEQVLEDNWHQALVGEKVQNLLEEYYGENIYPDYYGGMYISDDSKNLIIQVVKENIPISQDEYNKYKNIISLDNSIELEFVSKSYNYLNDLVDEILNNYYNNFKSVYIDTMNNKVVVGLDENNPKEQAKFKKSMVKSSSLFEVKDTYENLAFKEEEIILNARYNPGEKTQIYDTYYSIGFRTKYKGKAGFVTAGHCVDKVGGITQQGIVRLRQFVDGGKYDYSFIELDESSSVTNTLAYYQSISSNILAGNDNKSHRLYQNLIVAKSGGATKYTTGKIISTSSNIKVSYEVRKNEWKIYTINNLVNASYSSAVGDSGGPVFIPKTNKDGGSISIGIHSSSSNINKNESYFTSIEALPVELQTGRY